MAARPSRAGCTMVCASHALFWLTINIPARTRRAWDPMKAATSRVRFALLALGALIGSATIAAALPIALTQRPQPQPTPTVLPPPEQPFQGKVERLVKDSKPDFPKEIDAPKGAPNVL